MNQSLLAVVAFLTAVMLVIFIATSQPLNLTITAVVFTGSLGALAVYFYGREDGRQPDEDDDELPEEDWDSEPVMAEESLMLLGDKGDEPAAE